MDNVVQLQDQLGEMDRSLIFVKISLVRMIIWCFHSKCLVELWVICVSSLGMYINSLAIILSL